MESLLLTLNVQMKSPLFDVDDIIENHNNVIKQVFVDNPTSIKYALSFICDIDEASGKFK